MKSLAVMVLVWCALCGMTAQDAEAKSRRKATTTSADASGVQPQQGLENILNLWRDGHFEELYRHTTPSGRTTKEAFIGRISSASRRPASSWEKMQEVNVVMNGDDAATVHAKLGFEGGANGTEFSTRSYRLVKEDGVWKMGQADILALAGTAKRKHHRSTKK